MLRRSSVLSTSSRKSTSRFDYERAVNLPPNQLFTPDALVALPTGSAAVEKYKQEAELARKRTAGARRWMRGANETCVDSLSKSSSFLTSYEVSYRFGDPQWLPMLQLPCGNPVSLELRARHVNYALRHLVQRGHALYLIHKTDHSVLHPKGLAAVSHVVCSLDGKQERLYTSIIHEGPVDAADPDGEWGIVAASDSRSLARAFQRREMLWMRSRRIGSVQAQMGTFDWTLHHAPDVGCDTHNEVLLLKNETNFVGPALSARGIISSAHIAEHPFHYVNEFEAPAMCAADVFRQAMHFTAKNSQLVGATKQERLHAVAWKMRQFFPYNPIELDLPFQVMCGPPQVYRGADLALVPSPMIGLPHVRAKEGCDTGDVDPNWKSYGLAAVADSNQDAETVHALSRHEQKLRTIIQDKKKQRRQNKNKKDEKGEAAAAAAAESKMKKQLALIQFDLAIKQGASEYLYDQGNSSRAPYFWSQKNAMPYESTFWCVRDGLLDASEPVEMQPQFERMRSRLHTTSRQQEQQQSSSESFAAVQRDHHEQSKSQLEAVEEDDEDLDFINSQPLEVLLAQRREMRDQRKQQEIERAAGERDGGGVCDASQDSAWRFKKRFQSKANFGPFAGAEEDPASIENQAEMLEMLEAGGRHQKEKGQKKRSASSSSSSSPATGGGLSSRVASRQKKSARALERISTKDKEKKKKK